MKTAYLTCLLILALVAAPRVSSAGPDSNPTAAAEASAREHFQRGQKLSASGEYAAAYREFAAGYALTERPLFLFNMAEAARASGDFVKARDNYMQFLHADPKSPLATTAQSRLAEMDRAGAGSPATPPKTPPATARTEPTPTPSPTVGPPPAPAAGSAVTTTPTGTSREAPPAAVKPPPTTTTTGTASLSREQPSSGPEGKPMWKKWPFWAVVGGVVATGALALAVSRDADPCGDGCSQFNFR